MMGRIRIIGGCWRRRLLPVLDVPGLRPSTDRVRETLFNWLGQTLDGQRCLDMFAGTGALGFEAASRGAAYVLMLERNRKVAQQLRHNQVTLNASAVEVIAAEALSYAARLPQRSFDVIFLDPPFADNLLAPALQAAALLLRPGGLIYVESGAPIPLPAGFEIFRQACAGNLHYGLIHLSEVSQGISQDSRGQNSSGQESDSNDSCDQVGESIDRD